jgi:tetratricopeptide (TPR) repeat protein
MLFGLARCHFAAGRLEEALQWADKSILENPRAVNAISLKVAICGELGREIEAREWGTRLRGLSPGFSVTTYLTQVVSAGSSEELVIRWADGLRKAGISEI